MVVVTHNEIINAIVLAENVAYLNAKARNITLSNGETPCKADNDKAIEIEQWITILERAEAQVENGCIDSEDVWNLIQKINKQYRDVDCDVSRTFSRHSSSGGNDNPPTGYVERVLGVNVNNSNPSRPVVTVYVDDVTITGRGTQGDPFVAVGGGGGSGTVNNGTQYRLAYYATTGTAVSQSSAITASRVLISDSNGVPTHSSVTLTTLLFLDATSSIQTQLNSKVAANSPIIGATKTKITFDSKGLITSAVDATTTDITEGSNLYFTVARVLATILSGLSITGGAITSSDTILQAFGKLQNQINGIATPDLQAVTDIDNTTTNELRSSDGSSRGTLGNGFLQLITSSGVATIQSTNLLASVIFELPNKSAGTETFAMLSDLASYIHANGAITGATKTKITYDAKGLVTSGADATTADIADSTNKRYVTDANLTDISTISSKAPIASPTFTGTVTTPAIIVSSETASRIAILDASKNVKSADTATYPSLTELAYVKNLGSQAVGTSDTNTLTNKRITARTGTTTSSATPTINTDNVDFYSLTAQTVDITSFTTNLSGTPTEGQTLWIAITGTAARAITWGSSFEASTIALPTTTVTTNRLDVAFIWNSISSKWRCVGSV